MEFSQHCLLRSTCAHTFTCNWQLQPFWISGKGRLTIEIVFKVEKICNQMVASHLLINHTIYQTVLSQITSNSVFRENRCPKTMNFQFFYCCDLENYVKVIKSYQFFVMSQFYIPENLLRIQPLVHKILYRQERVTPISMKFTPKSICPPPRRLGDMKNWIEPDQTELNTKMACGVFMDNSEIIHPSSPYKHSKCVLIRSTSVRHF